jgi:hypothetical protein
VVGVDVGVEVEVEVEVEVWVGVGIEVGVGVEVGFEGLVEGLVVGLVELSVLDLGSPGVSSPVQNPSTPPPNPSSTNYSTYTSPRLAANPPHSSPHLDTYESHNSYTPTPLACGWGSRSG